MADWLQSVTITDSTGLPLLTIASVAKRGYGHITVWNFNVTSGWFQPWKTIVTLQIVALDCVCNEAQCLLVTVAPSKPAAIPGQVIVWSLNYVGPPTRLQRITFSEPIDAKFSRLPDGRLTLMVLQTNGVDNVSVYVWRGLLQFQHDTSYLLIVYWHWKLDDTPNVEVELLEKRPETPPVLRKVETLSAVGKSRPTSWTGNVMVKASADIRRVQQMDGDISRLRSRSVISGRGSIHDSMAGDSRPPSMHVLNYLGSVGSLISLEQRTSQELPVTMSLSKMRGQLKTRTQVDERPKWLRFMPRCPKASSILDLNLIKDPFFIVMSVAMALGRLSYQQFNVFVPSFAQSVGVPPTAAASLVTILAASDTVARLAIPILADKFSKYITTLTVFFIEFAICAVGSFAIALSSDFVGMVISCVIYGIGIGGITGLQVVVIVQTLGMDKLASAFGLNLFIGGLVVFPGIIIIGYIQVLTASFSICFHIVGGICILCCCLWAPLPMMLRRRNANLPK
ncbi:uncharacterized protein LOC124205390 [Daphnia pulex]|uniref:uncharacterized protein LOC124205390 n=1 Tax=Daphnia pulex TaxID=6669 RepID=UPI001EDF88CE|nr:uncharacterized protein LOC124205390 [Daphnia pulex]